MAFAAGMYVFPGGAVDPRDADAASAGPGRRRPTGPRRSAPTSRWPAALVCAAVRETFEESGVLLAGPSAARRRDTTATTGRPTGSRWSGRDLSLAELLARRGLVLRADLLRPWAHWITPAVEPRRYDTRFFVAALPAGQRPGT